MSSRFTTSRPCTWVEPRPVQDASARYRMHGPILPMDEPGFLSRLFGQGRKL